MCRRCGVCSCQQLRCLRYLCQRNNCSSWLRWDGLLDGASSSSWPSYVSFLALRVHQQHNVDVLGCILCEVLSMLACLCSYSHCRQDELGADSGPTASRPAVRARRGGRLPEGLHGEQPLKTQQHCQESVELAWQGPEARVQVRRYLTVWLAVSCFQQQLRKHINPETNQLKASIEAHSVFSVLVDSTVRRFHGSECVHSRHWYKLTSAAFTSPVPEMLRPGPVPGH
jgi:hypothetical protein